MSSYFRFQHCNHDIISFPCGVYFGPTSCLAPDAMQINTVTLTLVMVLCTGNTHKFHKTLPSLCQTLSPVWPKANIYFIFISWNVGFYIWPCALISCFIYVSNYGGGRWEPPNQRDNINTLSWLKVEGSLTASLLFIKIIVFKIPNWLHSQLTHSSDTHLRHQTCHQGSFDSSQIQNKFKKEYSTGGWWHLHLGVWAHGNGWRGTSGMVSNTSHTWFPCVWCHSICSIPAIVMSRPHLSSCDIWHTQI